MAFTEKLGQIIEFLTQEKGAKFPKKEFLNRLKLEDFSNYTSWDSDRYTRNAIFKNEHFELILLCWEPGQETPIHDHDGADCWVYHVAGEIEEQRYADLNAVKQDEFTLAKAQAGDLCYMHDKLGLHSLHNRGQERAITLHCYAHPIDSCGIYDEDLERMCEKEMVYTTFKGEKVSS